MFERNPITALRTQNAKDAYVALFNALGPAHYATLEAAYNLGYAIFDGGDNFIEAQPYLKESYEGLKDREMEVNFDPWNPGFYYAFTLFLQDKNDECLEIVDSLLDKYGEILPDEDIATYSLLKEFRGSILRDREDYQSFTANALDTFGIIGDYMDQSDPQYLHWMLIAAMGLKILGVDEGLETLFKNEKSLNLYEDDKDEVFSEVVDITIKMIDAFVNSDDAEKARKKIDKDFSKLIKSKEFKMYDEEERNAYLSALAPLFNLIPDRVNTLE